MQQSTHPHLLTKDGDVLYLRTEPGETARLKDITPDEASETGDIRITVESITLDASNWTLIGTGIPFVGLPILKFWRRL